MDKTYNVKITSQAEDQIQEVIYYITHELKAPQAALRLLDTLEDTFLSLTKFPQRVSLINEEPWRTKASII